MVTSIFVMTLGTIAVAALFLAPRMAEGRVVYDDKPDQPRSFGCQMSWLAIRTRDTQRVLDFLTLSDLQVANWNNGLGTIYSTEFGETHLFVSPPVNGWTFVVGLALPQPLGKGFGDKTTPLLLELGAEFIEVQYFLAHPDIDYFGWARVIDGKLVRAYVIGDQGVVWNKGKQSKEEKLLGVKFFEVRGVRKKKGNPDGELVLYPTEAHVMQLAGKWSLDPTRIENLVEEGSIGYVGLAPVRWRPERLRRSA